MLPNPDAVAGSAAPGVLVTAVSRRFPSPGGDVDALVDVSVTIRRDALTVLAGPSGSGKSTLLMLIAGADRPTDGDIVVNGSSLVQRSRRARRRWRRQHVGVVLPQPSDNLSVDHDAIGNLTWASRLRSSSAVDRAAAEALLEQVGLEHLATSTIAQLSGGEQMRLALVCAAVGDPTLVIVDEPTASLDAESAASVVAVLRRLASGGATVIVATHDAAIVDVADDVIRLDHGRLDAGTVVS